MPLVMWFVACGRCLKARPRQIRGEITTECWCAFFKCIRIGGPVCDVLHRLTERLFCLVSYLAHLQRWYRGCRQRFRGLRATSLCIHLGEQKTAAGECGGSADSSTRGRGLGCLHPAPLPAATWLPLNVRVAAWWLLLALSGFL